MATKLEVLTAAIVSSYLQANRVSAADLPDLVRITRLALERAGRPAAEAPEPVAKPTAAQIRKSQTPEALISFIDGRPYRMLRRHLRRNGLTPDDYRARYGLPTDYPMTASAYSEKRSILARRVWLGKRTGRDRSTGSASHAPPTAAGELAGQAQTRSPGEDAAPGTDGVEPVGAGKAKALPAGDDPS
jgi:predicted transcriptional regulator